MQLLNNDQNAGDVADLLICLGNLVGFDNIQKPTGNYLPGTDDILEKIEQNQSKDDMLKLVKVLIAMGENVNLYC